MRHIWLGCILLSTAAAGQAATLGRHSGAAVIGRPLDIRVAVLLGAGEDFNDLCVQSDVFYGDTQVSPGAVRVTPQRTAPDADASLRVQSSIAIDEPVVTVYVRTGCSAPFSRRYVLLADPVTEPQAAPTAQGASSGVSSARALPDAESTAVPATPSQGAGAPVTTAAAPGGSVAAPAALPPSAAAKTRRAGAAGTKPAMAVADRDGPKVPSVVKRPVTPAPARLELDPVDVSLSLDRDPVLKMSLSMLSEPAATDEEREVAARLWKAINASPEDILRDNQKLEVLEAEAKGLREQEARDKAALAEMQGQLAQSRYLSWLVYGLGALLLAALFALFYLWRKRGIPSEGDDAARAWWAAAAAEKEMETGIPMPNGKVGARALDLDLDLDIDKASSLDSLSPLHDQGLGADSLPPIVGSDKRDFAASQIGVSRSVATEELFDVQQQADFFISLGEDEQAIDVLKNHLSESQEPSPLAYLDLFKIYHRLDRRDEYQRLRKDFNRLFNASAPEFEHYSDNSRGLEDYETAFGRIQALWPQPRVLDVIQQSIFRDLGDGEAEVFDLEAYRELLFLHAIAKEVIQREVLDSRPSRDFEHTAIRPLKAAGNKALAAAVASQAAAGRETQPLDEIPHASPRLGLDVDLDALSEISAFEASLPEVATPVQPSAKPARPPSAAVEADDGNLIDFEMLDFMPPDEETEKPGKK